MVRWVRSCTANTSLAIPSGSQISGRCRGTIGVAENYVAVPFPAVRHVTCWLDRPQPAPAGAVSLSPEVTWLSDAGLRSASLEESPLPQLKARSPVQGAKGGKDPDRCGRGMELAAPGKRLSSWAIEEESNMPVLLLWAVPAVIVVGGVGYYLVRAVH